METGVHGLTFLFVLNLAMVELNRDLESVTVLLQLLVVLLAPVILLKIRNVKHKIVQKLLPQSQEHEQLQQLQLFQQL